MTIAIFGAAGAIGRVAVPVLAARGHKVRVVGRSLEHLREAFPSGVEYVAADLSDPAQARRAAEGADAILYSVGLPYPRFAEHPVLMRTTLDAARAAGVGKLLVISPVYSYGRPRTARVAETHPRKPHTRKGRYRKEQEDLVLAAHDPGGLRTMILRLPDFYGPSAEISYAKTLFDAVQGGTTANLLTPIDTPHEWIYVPDTAPVIADLLERDEAFGDAYNLGGATITTREFVTEIGRAAGRTPKTRAVTPSMVWLIGRFDPTMRELFEMLYLWSQPVVLDDTKLRAVLGPIQRTSFADGIAATVAATPRSDRRTSRWVSGSAMFRALFRRKKLVSPTSPTPVETVEPNPDAEAYHRWFYDTNVWQRMTWMGVSILKAPGDLWNYQELIFARKPRLIVEFGTNAGGSALFFAQIQRAAGIKGRVLSVDITHERVPRDVRKQREIEFLERSSSDPQVAKRIRALRRRYKGPIFVVVDSDHRAEHVYAELVLLRDVLRKGDYLVVEDGNINGHPVLPDFGPGPLEALERYTAEFPEDYERDVKRESMFGFTFAPRGYLIRR